MAIQPLSTSSQIVVYNDDVVLKDKTAIGNHQGVSVGDILALSGASGIPLQVDVIADGTDITTTAELEYKVNKITATSSDYAVKLPEPQLGGTVGVVNNSSVDVYVYPYDANDSIVGLAPGEPYIIPPDGQLYNILCVQNPNVGVWSVVTPWNGTSTVINYSVDMVVGDGIGTSVSGSGINWGVSSNIQVITDSQGNLLHREFLLGNNGNQPIIDMSQFAGYTEMRMKRLTIKTNIPTGDFSSQPSAGNYSHDAMGLTLAQMGTLEVFMSSAIWDFTDITQALQYSVGDLANKTFDPYYNLNYWGYLNGNANVNPALPQRGGITHYVATPGDLAYDSSNPSARYQKYELTQPDVITGYVDWQTIFDYNGNPARFIGFDAEYSDGSNPASGFPTGFEFKVSISIDWELK